LQLPAGKRRLPSFSEWEGWSVRGWVAGVDPALGVGDFEGVVGEEFGVPAGGVE
jgi:hypothetical protein